MDEVIIAYRLGEIGIMKAIELIMACMRTDEETAEIYLFYR